MGIPASAPGSRLPDGRIEVGPTAAYSELTFWVMRDRAVLAFVSLLSPRIQLFGVRAQLRKAGHRPSGNEGFGEVAHGPAGDERAKTSRGSRANPDASRVYTSNARGLLRRHHSGVKSQGKRMFQNSGATQSHLETGVSDGLGSRGRCSRPRGCAAHRAPSTDFATPPAAPVGRARADHETGAGGASVSGLATTAEPGLVYDAVNESSVAPMDDPIRPISIPSSINRHALISQRLVPAR